MGHLTYAGRPGRGLGSGCPMCLDFGLLCREALPLLSSMFSPPKYCTRTSGDAIWSGVFLVGCQPASAGTWFCVFFVDSSLYLR